MNEYGALVEWYRRVKTEVLWGRPAPLPLCPQIARGLAWIGTRGRLNPWATASPLPCIVSLKDEEYRVIHKSLRDFRHLLHSSRNGHAEGEHVNRGRDTPSCSPTVQVLDMSTLGDAADVNPANSKTQNAFSFPVHAMYRHDCPLAVKRASTPRPLVQTNKQTNKQKI